MAQTSLKRKLLHVFIQLVGFVNKKVFTNFTPDSEPVVPIQVLVKGPLPTPSVFRPYPPSIDVLKYIKL